MFECPNCSGNLQFDIASQQLKCSHCDTKLDPYTAVRENDANEEEEFDVVVYTCSQCGGEIQSTGDMESLAAGFCSFCGSTAILKRRLDRAKRPRYIIPFRLTQEDCKTKYVEEMKKSFFLPDELKDEKYLREFRGVYIPYWIYDVKLQGDVKLWGTKSKQSGDYIIADYYNIYFDLDYEYYGLAQDASSSFEDDIGERIVPFHVNRMQEFTPSFLSGFYTDTADVAEDVYKKEIEDFVNESTYSVIENYDTLKEYKLDKPKDLSEALSTKVEPAELALFPVWLLTYRKRNRVAYAMVNGLTGKVVSDTPVSLQKYLFASLLLAIPIFVVLKVGQFIVKGIGVGSILQWGPIMTLVVLALLTLVLISTYSTDLKKIQDREEFKLDKGKNAARERAFREQKGVTEEQIYRRKVKQQEQEVAAFYAKRRSESLAVASGLIEYCAGYIWINGSEDFAKPIFSPIWLVVLAFVLIVINVLYNSTNRMKQIESPVRRSGFWTAIIGLIIAVIHLIIGPENVSYYYSGVIVAFIPITYSMIQLVHNYNVLSTRKLPQYNYEGGEHNVL